MTADLLFLLVLGLQHLPDDGLQGPAQVQPAVGLPDWRDVHKGGAPLAQVQRRVVGKVTEIPEQVEEHREQSKWQDIRAGYRL